MSKKEISVISDFSFVFDTLSPTPTLYILHNDKSTYAQFHGSKKNESNNEYSGYPLHIPK